MTAVRVAPNTNRVHLKGHAGADTSVLCWTWRCSVAIRTCMFKRIFLHTRASVIWHEKCWLDRFGKFKEKINKHNGIRPSVCSERRFSSLIKTMINECVVDFILLERTFDPTRAHPKGRGLSLHTTYLNKFQSTIIFVVSKKFNCFSELCSK